MLTPTRVRELLASHGLEPRRAFGQNFVADPNTVRRIARLAQVGPDDRVVEIGPGLGSLTLALAETGAEVLAVEADRKLRPALEEVLADHDVRLVWGDALTLDWSAELGAGPWVVVANLPYNVATPLVLDLLEQQQAIARFVVMVQREVGERLVAPAGSDAYGIPSVVVAYRATGRILGRVGPEVFIPRPKVESAIVELTRLAEPAVSADPEVLFRLVRTAFGQRRKMLRRSLAGLVDSDQFEAAAIAPEARPEQLDIVAWGRLADVVGAASAAGPAVASDG